MLKVTFTLILLGLVLAQQPVLKCPKGATRCGYLGDKVNLDACYRSILYTTKDGNQSCEFSVDLSNTNIMLTGHIYGDTKSTFLLQQCDPGFLSQYYDNIYPHLEFCRPCGVNGCVKAVYYVKANDLRIAVCDNGYPSADLKSCVLRGDKNFNLSDDGLSLR